MRIILQFIAALQRAMRDHNIRYDEKAGDLEQLVGEVVNIDPRLLFSLAPESLVSMLMIGDFDEQIGGYVLRSIYLEADILEEAGLIERANLRRAQADAIAEAYGFDVSPADIKAETLEEYLEEQARLYDPEYQEQP
jgi:hypothetical protein